MLLFSRISFDLNEVCGIEIWFESSNIDVEEVYRASEAVVDNVGSREVIFELDLNTEHVDDDLCEDSKGVDVEEMNSNVVVNNVYMMGLKLK